MGLNQEVPAHNNIQYLNINSNQFSGYLLLNVIHFPIKLNKFSIKFTVKATVFKLVLFFANVSIKLTGIPVYHWMI